MLVGAVDQIIALLGLKAVLVALAVVVMDTMEQPQQLPDLLILAVVVVAVARIEHQAQVVLAL